MTPQTELELTGNFLTHPFAELVAEITQARLSGSLRVSEVDRKCNIYFRSGRLVFAVSNARSSRLFDILLNKNRLTKTDLAEIPNFSNDFEFTAYLQDKSFLTKDECDKLFAEQIAGIVIDVLSWTRGDWNFSPLARVRDGLDFDINTANLMLDYARCLPVEVVLGQFRSLEESFYHSEVPVSGLGLKPNEAFMLAQATDTPLTLAELVATSAMSESNSIHAIYTLWLCGLLVRNDWRPAFSDIKIASMREAKLALKREAKLPGVTAPVVQITEPENEPASPKEPAIIITLDEYLDRVETADTYYDILDVDPNADIDELKRAYFALARSFHPDHYHAEGGETLQRIQHAFTELAQAHETLKNPETREIYDYRMRKELAEREKLAKAEKDGDYSVQTEQAVDNFERGFSLLMDDEYEAATPFLARAVHFAPKNARYHAYYGKALSFDEKQRHKAEAELQTALKLDANNPTFRILLAEFFIQQNLLKRAEGELKRLLAVFPSNREARDLLNGLQK